MNEIVIELIDFRCLILIHLLSSNVSLAVCISQIDVYKEAYTKKYSILKLG